MFGVVFLRQVWSMVYYARARLFLSARCCGGCEVGGTYAWLALVVVGLV